MGSSDDDDILNDLCVDVILARSECTALAFLATPPPCGFESFLAESRESREKKSIYSYVELTVLDKQGF